MRRRFASLFIADRARPSVGRAQTASKREPPLPAGPEGLEARLLLSSLPLHVVGNQLEDSLGNVVVLRGVNVNSLEFRPDGDNVLQAESIAINDWHCNLIRLPVNEDYWFGYDEWWTGGNSGDGGAAYRALVGQIISTAEAANVYVMLDLHWSDMGVFGVGNDGQHFMPDNNSTLFWQSAAATYANNPAVLFDPYNEPALGAWNQAGGWWDFTPTPADWNLWRNGGTVVEGDVANDTGATIGTYNTPGMQGLINTIRATGATNIIAPEGLNWGCDLTGVNTGYALSDPTGNLMYQVHLYPGDDSTSAVAVGAQYPIYVGEWGDGGVVGQPSAAAAAWNTSMLAFLNAHNYSWTAWDLSPEVGSDLNLLTSWNAATTSDFGALVKADLAQHAAPSPGTNSTFAFADTDDWGAGFVGQITITNQTTAPIDGWTLGFNFPGGINPTPNTGIWNAQVVSHVGSQYQIQNASWDAVISPGQSVSFGFVATWDAAHTAPSGFAFDYRDLSAAFGTYWTLPTAVVAGKPLTGQTSVVVSNIGNVALPSGQQVNIQLFARDTATSANTVLATLSNQWVGGLRANASVTFRPYVNLPGGLTADTYQIEALVTPVQALVESRTDNNLATQTALGATKTVTSVPAFVDLAGAFGRNWSLPATGIAGKLLRGYAPVVVSNLGNVALPWNQQVNIQVIARDTTNPANPDIVLTTMSRQWAGGLAAGGSVTFYPWVSLPGGLPADSYEILATIAPVQPLAESRTDDNTATSPARQIVSANPFVDLSATFGTCWRLPTSVVAGKPLTGQVSVVVSNLGNVALPSGQQINIQLLAHDTTTSASTVLATLSDQWVSGLAAGSSATFYPYVNLPAGLTADTYQIEAIITPVQPLIESRLDNNTATTPAHQIVSEST